MISWRPFFKFFFIGFEYWSAFFCELTSKNHFYSSRLHHQQLQKSLNSGLNKWMLWYSQGVRLLVRICIWIVDSLFKLLIVDVLLLISTGEKGSCNKINLYHYVILRFSIWTHKYFQFQNKFCMRKCYKCICMYSDMHALCLVRQARDIGPLNE